MANDLYTEMGRFSWITFPDATSVEHLKKLKQETDETINSPDDISEYADCLLTLFGAAYRQGFTYGELMNATRKKLEIVKKRKWKKMSDGTYQHIKQ